MLNFPCLETDFSELQTTRYCKRKQCNWWDDDLQGESQEGKASESQKDSQKSTGTHHGYAK